MRPNRSSYFIIAAIALVVFSASCSTLGTSGVSAGQTPAQQAQGTINEANATLTAAANVVAQNAVDGTMSKVEAQSALETLRDYARQVDSAQALLNSGLVLDAQKRADVLKGLIVSLHRQVAAKARKPI